MLFFFNQLFYIELTLITLLFFILRHHLVAFRLFLAPIVHEFLESFFLLFIVYNLLLSPQKIDLTACYRAKISDYLLLNIKKCDLTADNRKKMRFFAISI